MGNELLASKIIVQEEAPSIRTLTPAPTAVLFALGITEKGPVRTPTLTTSFDEWVDIFGSFISTGELPTQIRQFFLNGGTQVYTSRVVHYTDITDPATGAGVEATGTLQTAAGGETKGETISGNAGPYALNDGDVLNVRGTNASVGWGPTAVTFNAAAGYAETDEAGGGAGGQEPFALADGDTLIIAVDGGANQTVTFNTGEFVAIGAATAEEVAAVINGELAGASATVVGGGTRVRVTSDTIGTGGVIDIDAASTSITGAKLDMSSGTGGTHSGTGDAVDIGAMTAAEVAAVIDADLAGDADSQVSGSGVSITSVDTGTDADIKVDGGTANAALGFDLATHAGYAAGAADALQIDGKYDGTAVEGWVIEIKDASSEVTEEFNLEVQDDTGVIREVFANLSMVDTDDRYVETIVNATVGGSIWITATDLDAARASQRPANGTVTLAGGDDGLTGLNDSDFIGSAAGQTGLRAFDPVAGGTLLIMPDRTSVSAQNAAITYAEVTRNFEVFAVLDPPPALDDDAIITQKDALTSSENYALYWPEVVIPNPSTGVFGAGDVITVPPSGSLAGMYARTDSSQIPGPFAQPVGIEIGRLFNVVDVADDSVLRESVRDKVFPKRINPIIYTPSVGIHPDGARTGRADGNFPSIGERRGVSFVELTLKTGLAFAKNQPNTAELRAAVRRTVRNFLLTQMSNGAFASKVPDEAFFVDISTDLNTADSVRAGKLIIRIGLATVAPAEWIIIRVTRDTRALDEAAQGRPG